MGLRSPIGLEALLGAAEQSGIDKNQLPIKVQERYQKYFQNANFDGLNSLQEVTGIEPDFPIKFVQPIYDMWLDYDKLRHLEQGKEITGIKPQFSTRRLQKKFDEYFGDDDVQFFKRLQELTQYHPTFSARRVQRKYQELLDGVEGHDCMTNIEALTGWMDMIQVPIKEKAVQEKYQDLANGGYIEIIKYLQQATKVAPKFSEEEVQIFYHDCLKDEDWSGFKEWRELTRVPPDEKNQTRLQEVYQNLVYENDLDMFKELMSCGIKPSLEPEKVNTQYNILVQQGKFVDLVSWINQTEIEPSADVVKSIASYICSDSK